MTSKPASRILLVTRNFPPLMGGMEKLNWHLAEQLARRVKVRLIAPHGAARQAPSGIEIVEVPLRPLWRFLLAAFWQALRQARAFRPDTILAGSGLTAPLAWIAARLARARAVAYVHGLDLAVRHPLYHTLWLPAIRRLDRIIANSQATAKLARQAGVPAERIAVVYPGVELPKLSEDKRLQLRQAFRLEHGLGERPVLLAVGRLTTRKGLVPFVREVLPLIAAKQPDVLLAIVGEAPKDALAAQAETPQQIMAAAHAAGVGAQVVWVGPKFGTELSTAYLAADVHIFPVREIPADPEGFGMVAIEAAAHGLPTVAYATGGVVEAVADGISGRLVPPGDSQSFAQAVLETLCHPQASAEILGFAAQFAWPRFGGEIARWL